LTYQRNQLWSNAVEIWRDTVAKSPNKVRPRFQLAFVYYQSQHCAEAVEEYGKVAQLAPPNFDLLMDWALAEDCAGQSDQAIEKLKQAAAMKPGAHAYSMLGREYGKTGRYPEALDALAKAAQLDPRFAMTYYTRGAVYESQGNKAAAVGEYRHALALDPHLQPASDALQRLGQ
jgi:tetratricopeptide (TPR) repeat protein